MKEEKVDYDLLTAAAQSGALTLTNAGALQFNTIIAPNSNETISIVIPCLPTQLANLSKNGILPQVLNKSSENNVVAIKDTPKTPVRKAPPTRIKEDKTKGCPYPTCSRYGRAFSRAHDLKRHIARHEQRENKTLTSTTTQQQVIQSEVPLFPCPLCGSQFYNEVLLEKHKSMAHGPANLPISQGPYLCHVCKKVFEHETQFHSHMSTHVKSESHSNTMLTFHPQMTSPPPLAPISSTSNNSSQSTSVDDDFRLEDMLLIRKPLGQQPQKISNSPSTNGKIRCEYCSKTFKTKWTLSSHVAAHEGRYQYQCCICTKRFVRKSHYESHVRSHNAARPFVCEHCGKTFKESKHRREHLKRKHPANKNNAIQSLLDSLSASVNEDSPSTVHEQKLVNDQKLTVLMPMNFTT
ncbi:zinc finger protein 98-like [Trichogramma pretiosum]|uniref:zinc finger protein 98-like n=1 Tax=Trichogramma pretiosum TaxID=7493 RepID=UPI0006C9DAF9|nr:zinc finger protein 98-like [Trichogramma pretiosum]XP_014235046.1 zinc finger protein 98-like [Trichogramma pretiosum]XP_014235047.1 zinc finger protein 98-like [Trichogramma pretiosum]